MNAQFMTAFQKTPGHRAADDAEFDETDLRQILNSNVSGNHVFKRPVTFSTNTTWGDLIVSLKWPLP